MRRGYTLSIWRRISLASTVTLFITLSISILPGIHGRESADNSDQAVFRAAPLKGLSSGNLVDSIISLQLQLKPARVDWKGAVLSVDLSVESEDDGPEIWANDMQRLLRMAFIQASNVKRVLIRYMEPLQDDSIHGPDRENRPSKMRMLAAADVRYTDAWLMTELDNLNTSSPFTDSVWRGRLRLLFSDIGSSRLQ